MFGNTDKLLAAQERLYEARITDLKKEHQRTVEALTAWIEQLQIQVGAPQLQPVAPGSAPEQPNKALYMGEEEEAIRDAFDNGLIDEDQLYAALLSMGEQNQIVPGT